MMQKHPMCQFTGLLSSLWPFLGYKGQLLISFDLKNDEPSPFKLIALHSPQKLMNKKKNLVSIHDAAHVVASIKFEHSFIYVTIIPDEKTNSLGHVLPKLPKKIKDALDIGDANPFVFHYAKEEMIILLVGQAAESRILKIPFKNNGTQGDISGFTDYVICLYPEPKVYRAYFNYILEEARSFVSNPRNWKAIKAIAS